MFFGTLELVGASTEWDVVIIGAGAAGLMAAASAGSRGLKTLLLEKNKKLGVKIFMSGGTRCNITHNCGSRDIAKAFGPNGRFLLSALSALSPTDVLEKFRLAGVPSKVESTGKVFPVSDRAIDVRDALVSMARKQGVEIRNECSVLDCEKQNTHFRVVTESSEYSSRSLLITSGGRSYPGCGTTGDGYAWAKSFGHSVTPLGAALTPIVSQVAWANHLKGISVDEVSTSVMDQGGQLLSSSDQPLLFTHFGFSGPGPMNVSRSISLFPEKSKTILVDLYPGQHLERLVDDFYTAINSGEASILSQLLSSNWPRRLKEALLETLGMDSSHRLAEISKKQIRKLAQGLKRVEFPIHGTRGYAKAEVTAGGVDLKEVSSSTMESKLVDGLYFAGEILDLDGPIGGFNFQSAFSTGWLAGQNVNRKKRDGS